MMSSQYLRSITKAAFAVALLTIAGTALAATAVSPDEGGAEAVFNRVKDDQSRLRVFMQAMPKGANLHNHLDGSVYAETYIKFAAQRGFCSDFEGVRIARPPCKSPEDELKGMALRDPPRYERFADLISRRSFRKGYGFDIPGGSVRGGGFPAIYPISVLVPTEAMVLARTIAASDHLTYTEFIYHPDVLTSTTLAASDPQWNPDDLEGAYKRLRPRMESLVKQAVKDFEQSYAESDRRLGCGTAQEQPACRVEVRFLSYTMRNDRQDQIFQALIKAFMLADADPRYVGFHLVGWESQESSIEDYDLHMRMIRLIGSKFPRVHRALHTDEMTLGKAPPYALVDHIKKAIEIAGAERIGHGTSIAFEAEAVDTLAHMTRDNIAVEVNQTSNEGFGVAGSYHPIGLYIAAGVPVTIATDNTGMSRLDLSNEYMRAAYEHKLSYKQLKYIARTGMQVTFLPGDSIWENKQIGTLVPACGQDRPGSDSPSAPCKAFLAGSEKARMQWRHEQALATFEKNVQSWRF